jgi:HlyD family secretion protein
MTANVNIEIARRTNVVRVPNPALRFRPTAEIFAALGQTPPPTGGGRGRGTGAADGPDTRKTPPSAAPATPQAALPAPRAGQQSQRTARPEQSTAGEASGGTTTNSAGGRGAGSGRRGGGGNFAERMASMTPEERERFAERMKAREANPARQGGPPTRAQGPARAQAAPDVTTFDALFPPLVSTETFGQVWLRQNGQLQRARLRLGITDGQQTELIQAMDGDVKEGTEVVTSVIIGAARQAPVAPAGNAFPGLGGGRQGGFGGGRRGGG